ncbi:MAG: DNA gyrase inhibitor YacG, partial [Candidatus Nitrotoga sp.]
MNKPVEVACPQCGRKVIWSAINAYRPFCSERCKRVDLGQWATGSYSI